jgi:DEAD/DEAH box helicase domain-containing protein
MSGRLFEPPPRAEDPMQAFLEHLARSKSIGRDIVHLATLPARPAEFRPLADPLPAPLEGALRDLGLERPFTHQAEAIDRVRSGDDVLTVTPTASGKSLVYLVPTFESALLRPGSRALYVFPYKALAQDQKQGIDELAEAVARRGGMSAASGLPLRAEIYDGDTSDARRRAIKADPPDILITNPDMLHLGILAYHDSWRPFFAQLDFVVLDELHVYRGIFGSHLHHIVKRLRRLADLHGAAPRFIASSATVARPERLGAALVGRPVTVVEKSGAPRAERHLMLVQPAGSPYTAAVQVLREALDAGFRTIAFTKARLITELLYSWLLQADPSKRRAVSAYRSGYLPEERRDIERRLFSGDLRGVISTSALELGVDIGGLDVCLLVGYPGSIVSTWQRIGRVGREDRPALTVLVALPDALDQYFMNHPEQITARGFEEVVFDPDNPVVARAHLACAGAERPLEERDRALYGERTWGLVLDLERDGTLARDALGERWFTLRRRPQRDVNLRSSGHTYAIEDESRGRVIGTLDAVRAFHETHEGAVYMHHGRQYLVRALDLEARRARVVPAALDYYTQVRGEKETAILEVLEERQGVLEARLGRLEVTERITGYEKRRLHGRDRLGVFDLRMPPMIFETVGLWLTIPEGVPDLVRQRGGDFMGALHAAEHAMIALFPLLAISDRGDIGGISYIFHPQVGAPAIFVYDGHEGGAGLAAKGFADLVDLLGRTADLLRACPCEDGCPSCVQSPKCGNGNQPLDKVHAALVLEILLGREPLPAGTARVRPRPVAPIRPRTENAAAPPVPARAVPAPASAAAAAAAEACGTVYLDLETQRSAEEVGGWGNIAAMKMALAITWDDRTGAFRTYHEKDLEALLADLHGATRVVGYNIDRFDLEVLRGHSGRDVGRIRTHDMLAHIYRRLGFRLKLADVAEATLGIGKSADGLQSLRWWKEGRLDLIEEYCRKDVEVTRDLHRYGVVNGFILYRDRTGNALRLPVAWV